MRISKKLVWAAIGLILATGLIHLVLSPHHFEEAKYVGILFSLNGIGAAVAAFGIYRNANWGWTLGAIIAAFSVVSYIASRTVGLPGTEIEDWDLIGVISLIVESVFILVYVLKIKKR